MTEQGPAVQPATPEQEEALRVVLLDQSRDARDEARDLADARLDQELGEGGRTKRFLNGIWKGNIAKEYYRQRYTHQALDTIQAANDVLVTEADDRRARALEATIDRFTSEHDELIHTDAGERREVQSEDSQLTGGIKHLIREFAEGRLSADALQEERTRLLADFRAQHGEDAVGKGIVTADNLLAIAKTVAGVVEHGESLDHALNRLQVVTGEVRNSVRTEARYNAVDTVIDKLTRTRVGSLVTPSVLATGVAAAAAIARAGSHSVVGAATKTLLPGAAAGAWAGLRENKRVKDERAQHAREMATGGSFKEGDTRRVEMEEARYESIAAGDLIAHLQTTAEAEVLRVGGNEAVQAALDALAAVQARVQLSDNRKIDLISYSSKSDVGEERMLLDLARREARLAVESELSDEVRQALGLEPSADIKDILQTRADVFADTLTNGSEGISEKDKIFAQLKRRRVAKAAAIGVATGVIGGLLVQEAVAGVDPTRHGLIDIIQGNEATPYDADGEVHHTLLAGALRGDETRIHTGASSEYTSHSIGERGSIEISNDHTLVTNPDGTIHLVAGNNEVTVEGLVTDANGTFDQASLDKLEAAGMVVEDTSYDETITTTTTQQISVDQFLQNHAEETTHIKRDFWYGNDTPGVYDHNELRLHFGGNPEAPGIVDGGYEYSVAGMSPEGSWQGGEEVDWNQAAANGNLFAAISPTLESQADPIMVPINPDGSFFIDANGPAGQFFSNENGAVFNGAYMEVVETASVDPDGTVHVRPLATLVGSANVQEVTDTLTTSSTEHHAAYAITTAGYDTVQTNFTQMAPITPIASRRSMEALRETEPGSASAEQVTPAGTGSPNRYGYYGYEALSPEEQRQRRSETSPRLLNNPNAQLQTGEELQWFRESLERTTSKEYVAELDRAIDRSPELQAPNPNLRSMVVIPVGAVGEADNIYKSLSLYAQQDPASLAQTKVLLHVNWVDSAEGDPEKAQAIAKTKAEIERARVDFPGLSIATIETVWSQEKLSAGEYGNGLIGHVARRLYDTALLAVQRQIAEGTIPADQEVLMIRNDADAQGMDRRYLTRMMDTASQHLENDVFTGAVRWETGRYRDMPGLAFVANLQSTMELAAMKASVNQWPKTVGINTAVRMSTLAAVGSIGHSEWDTGAGSDDLSIGGRIGDARGGKYGYGGAGVQRRSSYYDGTPSYGNTNTGRATSYAYHRLVAGTGIDSKADRIERSYLYGAVARAWDNFDIGGYQSRSAGLESLPRKEDLTKDAPTILKRIEDNVTGIIERSNPAQLSAALAIMLPAEMRGKRLYRIASGADGRQTFHFTDDGAQWLINRLQRNGRGQFDAIGNRVRRQLYSETRGKLRPASAQPRFVS